MIIDKYDRKIKDTLLRLNSIDKDPLHEIIVVDASDHKLDDIKYSFPNVRWNYYKNKFNKKITISEQRNLGIKKSKGDIIVFVDSGCIPEVDWLKQLTSPILNDNESIVCGKTLSMYRRTYRDQICDCNKNVSYVHECATINIAIRRSVFDKTGYFDENFTCGEDIDFSWRAVDEGYLLKYAPKAIVRHDWGSLFDEMKRAYAYGRARTRLYNKHRNRIHNILSKDIVLLVYGLFIVFLPVTFIFPYYLGLLFLLLIKNYNKDPFHVVLDHIIFSFGALRELFLLL